MFRALAVTSLVLGFCTANVTAQSGTPAAGPAMPAIPNFLGGYPGLQQAQPAIPSIGNASGQSQQGSQNANDPNRDATDRGRDDARRDTGRRDDEKRNGTNDDHGPAIQDRQTEFQQLVQATTGQALPIYGASLFQNAPSTFAPTDNIPVSADYILGTEDEIQIHLFGQVNRQLTFTVDRNGAIAIPEVGPVHVAGLRFDALQSQLKREFAKIYRNFDLTVNLGRLRTISVFVTGQARRPGMYTVSSLSTLVNALFASGGILPQGSLRRIQVLRGRTGVTNFDLYDLVLRGDKSKDVRLEPGDVIFVPVAGPQIAVTGSIVNPAIYELQPGTTVSQVVELAGGGTSVAALAKVRLDRIFEHAMRSIVDVNLMKDENPVAQNGDILTVGTIADRFTNAVTLRGNVANPGRYVWHKGMRITDIIPNKDALVTREYFHRRNQLGQFVTDYNEAAQSVQSGALQARQSSADLAGGAVRGSGTSSSGGGGTSVGAALTAGAGVFGPRTDVVISAPDVNWSYAVIERQNPVDLTTGLIPFSLGKIVFNNDQSQNIELFPNDVVTIFSTADIRVPSEQQTRFVRLEGEFFAAGVYSVQPGETFRQLLARAGGLTPQAYLYGSTFTRQSTKRIEKQRLLEYADVLEAQVTAFKSTTSARAISPTDAAADAAGTADAQRAITRLRQLEPDGRIVLPLKPNSQALEALPDLPLEDGDRFVVPRVPAVVTVQGQVYSANAFVYELGLHTKDYMKLAGGPDRLADKKRFFVLRADGSVFSQQYGDVLRASIFPGDTIVVPPVLDRHAILRNLLDISTVVGQFGLGAASIEVFR